ncbi:MAG: peptidoglycan-binding protein [Clostridia bacterium]|nr:peptidoglycan-binding protein [Clostridia bacterium]
MGKAKSLVMKKRVWLAALTALLVCLCASALAASYPFTTTVTAKVNMRRSASSAAALVDRIPEGDTVTVVGAKGNYYKVKYDGRTGYVMKTYVRDTADAIATPAPAQQATATGYPYDTVTTSSVNLRAKQSTSSTKLDTIPQGATITVEKISGTFAKVTYKGQEGYVKTDYIVVKTIVKATAAPTATPVVITPSPVESASSYRVLTRGCTGDDVVSLQEALVELGFLSGTADGVFGAGTHDAVVAFQQKNSYPDTGVVDANLQAFIYSGKPKNVKGAKTDVKTLAPVDGISIKLNDKGALVKKVQTRLTELGYYAGDVNGTYDKTTRAAVKTFQKKNGLTADGICGDETQKKLFGGSALTSSATPTPKPTPTPTAVPTYQAPSDTVRRGDSGADARMVQQRLKDLGYYTGKVDGKFGSGSVAALETFQKRHGLEADGVAGQATYDVLFTYRALAVNATPTPVVTAQPLPTPAPTYAPITKDNVVTVRLGSKGDHVVRLQKRLTELGYYTSAADGECKAADVAAIKAFQKKNGLKADGAAGYETQLKLYSESALTYGGAIAGGSVQSFTTLRKGMTGDAVTSMQQRLVALGYLTGEADGRYGSDTAEAVYAFQKNNGLVRDGVAGSKTLSLLYSSLAKGTDTASSSLADSDTLRKGDASAAVKLLQQRLISLGYLSGDADGKFGLQTYRALKAFQKANGLFVDGVAGKNTLEALDSINAASSGSSAGTSTGTDNGGSAVINPMANLKPANVQYKYWYSYVREQARQYQYATIYDFSTGISWQVHMFSFGKHAEVEPLTAADTARMNQSLGGTTWTPRAVWVLFGDGSVYMASTHSTPHGVQHITDNNFAGHGCLHFPRTDAQVAAIGPYATSHQKAIDAGWKATQSQLK